MLNNAVTKNCSRYISCSNSFSILGLLWQGGGVNSGGVNAHPQGSRTMATMGAQGNALKTILPMAYVLNERHGEEASGETIIEANGVAHHIKFEVNGRGIPAKTIEGILDYSVRVSSREAYVSPTRDCGCGCCAAPGESTGALFWAGGTGVATSAVKCGKGILIPLSALALASGGLAQESIVGG
jgi:hypothetical protein